MVAAADKPADRAGLVEERLDRVAEPDRAAQVPVVAALDRTAAGLASRRVARRPLGCSRRTYCLLPTIWYSVASLPPGKCT